MAQHVQYEGKTIETEDGTAVVVPFGGGLGLRRADGLITETTSTEIDRLLRLQKAPDDALAFISNRDAPPCHLQGKTVYFYDRQYSLARIGDGWYLQLPPQSSTGGTWLPIPWKDIHPGNVGRTPMECPHMREFFDLLQMPRGTRATIQLTHPRICNGRRLHAFLWVVTRLGERTWRFENGSEWFDFSREDLQSSQVDRRDR